jgi:hypothetical protein
MRADHFGQRLGAGGEEADIPAGQPSQSGLNSEQQEENEATKESSPIPIDVEFEGLINGVLALPAEAPPEEIDGLVSGVLDPAKFKKEVTVKIESGEAASSQTAEMNGRAAELHQASMLTCLACSVRSATFEGGRCHQNNVYPHVAGQSLHRMGVNVVLVAPPSFEGCGSHETWQTKSQARQLKAEVFR